ncbi:hypothetical protein IWW34DRAFT_641361, partial [Fusarium oxysporum f. sp. albedinis]
FPVIKSPTCPASVSANPKTEATSDYHQSSAGSPDSLCIRQSSQDVFNCWVQSHMPKMVWAVPCFAWCK